MMINSKNIVRVKWLCIQKRIQSLEPCKSLKNIDSFHIVAWGEWSACLKYFLVVNWFLSALICTAAASILAGSQNHLGDFKI